MSGRTSLRSSSVGTHLPDRVEDSKHKTSRTMDLDQGCGARSPWRKSLQNVLSAAPSVPDYQRMHLLPDKWQPGEDFRTASHRVLLHPESAGRAGQGAGIKQSDLPVTQGVHGSARSCRLVSQSNLTAYPPLPKSTTLLLMPCCQALLEQGAWTKLDSNRNSCGKE